MQLATIQRNAAGKALVADVKAKNLDASPVELLRIVKVRCRRCDRCLCWNAPRSPGVLRTWEYSSTPGILTQLSTVEHSSARWSTTPCAGVFYSIVECSSVHAAEVTTLEYPGTLVP